MKRNRSYVAKLVCLAIAMSVLAGSRAWADFIVGEPTLLGPTINGPDNDSGPDLSADGLSLFFCSERSGTAEIWMTTRPTKDD